MKIFNSITRKKEDFVTVEENKVSMYVCGATVYDYIHIGNARPYVIFDTVRRYLEYKGYDVNYVQNFTDVDDKIINRAISENTTMNLVSEKYIDEATKDIELLNIKKPTHAPKVTEEIPEIIEMIEGLIDKDHAYTKNGDVYFHTRSFEGYGKLSKRNLEDLEMGSRVDINLNKKDPTDFVLWKARKEGEPFWDSPWGEGRPGWHIECSAMAKKYLGDTIDIHAGGEDLIFPHHENEIAQSECANGRPFAKYWLHNGFINIDNEKMSKSKGNFFTLRDIANEFSYEVVRFFILTAHYRSPINFSSELLKSAETSLERISTCLGNIKFIIENCTSKNITDSERDKIEESKRFRLEFIASMDDDFNTADAISLIFELVRFANTNTTHDSSKEFATQIYTEINDLCNILGIVTTRDKEEDASEEIERLIEERQQAKKNKDFKEADKIRDTLLEMGIMLEDTRQGVRWSRVK